MHKAFLDKAWKRMIQNLYSQCMPYNIHATCIENYGSEFEFQNSIKWHLRSETSRSFLLR